MPENIQYICAQFLPHDSVVKHQQLQGGLINKTYLIYTASSKKYILQQINNNVFKNVPVLMQNLSLITQYFQKKIEATKEDAAIQTFQYYATESEELFYKDKENKYWRLSNFIENTSITSLKPNIKIAQESGFLFGFFIKQMTTIDLTQIEDTIPGFHQTHRYHQAFKKTLTTNRLKRHAESKEVAMRIQQYEWLLDTYNSISNNANISKRLVHNDTKVTNLLFDSEQNAIAVIDLDTCMAGYLMSDFGDAIRSLTNTGKEDDLNLDQVQFDLPLFKAFAKGFLAGTKGILQTEEKDHLAVYALIITYEQVLRFYTDYLNGDSYYQTDYPTHNLQRTLAQLKLLDEMIVHLDEMKKVVKEI